MKDYEISNQTLAVIPVGDNKSKIVEKDCSFVINKSPNHIMDESCKYYGSSINNRQKGTTNLTGITYKVPIFIEEEGNMIFFPTSSPRLKKCCWVSLNNIESYYYDFDKKRCIIVFDNKEKIEFDVSYCVLNNQILKSHRLESIINKRKSK
ncbi:MAG: competence protein ComK [Bacilli bacterium]|nr:competence protein ComK [Bacilli bacterium]